MTARFRPARPTLPGVRRPRGLAVVTLALLVLLAAACSGGDDDSGAAADETTTSARPTTTESDEEPPGTEPEEVRPYIEDLLQTYSDVLSQIVADPEIASDPQHTLYDDLLATMDPGSEMALQVVDALVERGEDGISQRPFEEDSEDSGPVNREVDGNIETVSENEVSFPTCTRLSYRLYDASGRQTGYSDGRTQPGRASAVRVDGHWRISHFEVFENESGCQGGAR